MYWYLFINGQSEVPTKPNVPLGFLYILCGDKAAVHSQDKDIEVISVCNGENGSHVLRHKRVLSHVYSFVIKRWRESISRESIPINVPNVNILNYNKTLEHLEK